MGTGIFYSLPNKNSHLLCRHRMLQSPSTFPEIDFKRDKFLSFFCGFLKPRFANQFWAVFFFAFLQLFIACFWLTGQFCWRFWPWRTLVPAYSQLSSRLCMSGILWSGSVHWLLHASTRWWKRVWTRGGYGPVVWEVGSEPTSRYQYSITYFFFIKQRRIWHFARDK